MKLAIVTGVWQRPQVFEMFAKGVKDLIASTNMDVGVFVAGSEGRVSRRMVDNHRFTYIEIPNEPLSKKMNATIRAARDFGADYVLCLGSDDIISVELFALYEKYMGEGIDYIGVLDFYFYDIRSKKSMYWGGYIDSRRGSTCGAGRILSSRLLSLWDWEVWDLKNSGMLDTGMELKLKNTEHTSKTFKLKDEGVYGVDIKSNTNMTPFHLWANTKYINSKELTDKFPYLCAE